MSHRNAHKPQPSWHARLSPLEQYDGSNPRPSPHPVLGVVLVAASIAFLLLASYTVFFSAFLSKSGIWVLDTLADDKHYKYLLVLLIASYTGFVIANWVGWQYYRNS
ncbi:uncharacterized protein BXZ73DRAFT_95708 [Epithele typhae]|uniref:uncharacterized protein n=1 Tax=Epithele typhae TaxID=378194 RepID=UPI002008942C|nr:uncharacterized protein BXZ73DRAFT_95708 [Epithele typhae]KAH9946208.1 hypothetical protein BXZ73DRAFT_95708 [Epithele typhae]